MQASKLKAEGCKVNDFMIINLQSSAFNLQPSTLTPE